MQPKAKRGAAHGIFFAILLILPLPALAVAELPDSSPSQPLSCNRPAAPGYVSCFARGITRQSNHLQTTATPDGLGPAQFHAAYNMPDSAISPVTIAVVTAYHDPNIAKDLAAYDRAYSLPSPKFQQLSQRGGQDFTRVDPGWALETSMDVEIAHQMCQNCPLLLVEADSPSLTNLMKAIDLAASRGAAVISNSYGGPELASETRYEKHLDRPGTTMTFSSGDSGYGVSFPAASPSVVAVGGTKLRLTSAGHRRSETVWSGAGSGCSQYESKPDWQHDSGCANRTVADVAADADPTSGAAVYDSLGYQGQAGWFVLGGTSLSSPLVAGMIGLAGGLSSPGQLYGQSDWARDVVTGSNGDCGSYLCAAKHGYDGPTGLGSPNDLQLF